MLSWDQDAYKSWRKGCGISVSTTSSIVGHSPINIGKSSNVWKSQVTQAKPVQVCEDKPDEWLETWVANISGNVQGTTRTPAWVLNKNTGGAATVDHKEEGGAFIDSFKAVGFTPSSGSSNHTNIDNHMKKQCSHSSSAGNLVTMKASSMNNCHFIYFPSQYTGRLIGKNGKKMDSLKEKTKAKNIIIKTGSIEVHGSYSIAQCTLLEVRKSLTYFSSSSDAFSSSSRPTNNMPVPKKKSITSPVNEKTSNTNKQRYLNVFKCLDMSEEDGDAPSAATTLPVQEQDEAVYDVRVEAGCAWVAHRNATIQMLQESIKNDSLATMGVKKKSTLLTKLSQDIMTTILSFFKPSEAIASAVALANMNKKLAFTFFTCYHRVWRSLASSAWPQLGLLRTKQPLLYPLACAMHQHRIINDDSKLKSFQLSTGSGSDNRFSRMFHSIGYNSISVKTAAQVYALELEYTLNPRTATCDAMKVKGVMTFSSLESLKQYALPAGNESSRISSSGNNPTILVPCFRGARQWQAQGLKTFAIAQLHSVGCLGRKQFKHQSFHGPNEVHLLAPLKPLLATMKTYMVNVCDGSEIDMDSFVCVWRLLLALTDPSDREGNARRMIVQHDLKQFTMGRYDPSDLGNFIPYILIVDPSEWSPILRMYLNKAMSKNVMWNCRDLCLKDKKNYIDFYKKNSKLSMQYTTGNGMGVAASGGREKDELSEFLKICFDSGCVSRRTVLFWVSLQCALMKSNFLGLKATIMERDRAELVHGFIATNSLKHHFNTLMEGVKQIDTWKKLFGALESNSSYTIVNTPNQPSNNKPTVSSLSAISIEASNNQITNLNLTGVVSQGELLSILQSCYEEALEKKYFTENTDFGAIHANGGSNLFLIGNRFSKAAFMIDRSGSMCRPLEGYGKNNHNDEKRYEAVSTHLLQLLESKPTDFAFSVKLFDTRIDCFQNGKLHQNTPSIRKQLKQFLSNNGPRGGTDLVLALKNVLNVKDAEEVFLLTDGEAGGEQEMIRMASSSSVPIHCIGISMSTSGSNMLSRISRAGKGECSFVDAKQLSTSIGKAA